MGGICTALVKRGTPLPTVRSQTFSTATDNQKSVEIRTYYGERPLSKNNIFLGSFSLSNIPLKPKGIPQISVTFHIDVHCNVTIEALEIESKTKTETKYDSIGVVLTKELIKKTTSDAEINTVRDDANLALAEAQLILDKEKPSSTNYKAIDEAVSELGSSLMSRFEAPIILSTNRLNKLMEQMRQQKQITPFSSFDDIFGAFSKPTTKTHSSHPARNTSTSNNQFQPNNISDKSPSIIVDQPMTITPIVAQIQSFLERIDPELESKRIGAWKTLESATPDALSQACHSMREVITQLLEKLSPSSEVIKSPWYKKPKEGSPVTRSMKIRYAIAGSSATVSDSTLNFINAMAEVIDAMYSKLSAETHSHKKAKVSSIRIYLNACEALIGIITTECIL